MHDQKRENQVRQLNYLGIDVTATMLNQEILEKALFYNKNAETEQNKPATQMQLDKLRALSEKIPANITKGEAGTLIFQSLKKTSTVPQNASPAPKEIPENITRGDASKLIAEKIKEKSINEMEQATEKQLELLVKWEVQHSPNISKGDAYKLIHEKKMNLMQ